MTLITPAGARLGAGSRLAHLAVGVWEAARSVLARLRHRRVVAGLLSLDDRMLADIGVTRGDVASTLSLPLDRDPSTRLLVLAIERRSAHRALARESRDWSRSSRERATG